MEKKKFLVKAEIKVELTQQDIDDIMVAALEGGINYWAGEAEVIEEKRVADWGHEQIARSRRNVGADTGEVPERLQALGGERRG